MLSLTSAVGFAAPATALKPSSSPSLQWYKTHPCLPSSRQYGWSRLQNTRFLTPNAVNTSAGQSDCLGKLALGRTIDSLRKIWETLPQPVRSFPWDKALGNFFQLISELVLAVAKFLCIPVLAVSSLSEMSYCAHERKMALIPIPLLAGLAVAGVLRDTAVELSPDVKEGEFPWHLLLIAICFTLLKLPGPYYPYWGRLVIPHFANGGLWRTIWFAFLWYKKLREASEMTETSVAKNQSEENKFDPSSLKV